MLQNLPENLFSQNNKELAAQLHLKDASFYNYLNQSSCAKLEGDARRLDTLRLAFNVLQVPTTKCNGIFQTLSAILWLGNLNFEDIDGEKCQLSEQDNEILEIVSNLLELEIDSLKQVVLLRQINVRGNITEIPLKLQEVCALYWVVKLIVPFDFRLEKINMPWLKLCIHVLLHG